MGKKINLKILIIIVLTILVFIYLVVFNIKKNTKVEVNAEVSSLGTNYVIVTDSDNKEYLLNTNEQYNIGDKVNVVLKNLKKGSPYTGEIIKIDTVSRSVSFSITDTPINTTEEEKVNINEKESETNTSNDTNIVNSTNNDNNQEIITNNDINNVSTDDQVVAYFNNFSNEIDDNSSINDSIKEKFVIIVDFLFYDGTIGERTFDELATSTKLKVLEIALSIDQKISNKFPGYKESISNNGKKIYTNVKSKVIELYLDITTSVCQDNQELCNDAKIGLGELKASFSLTWDFIKEISGVGIKKLKDWYEIWREI